MSKGTKPRRQLRSKSTASDTTNPAIVTSLATAKWLDILEIVPAAVVAVDAEGNIVLANSRAEALFGYTRAELTGSSVEMLVPERYRSKHVADRQHYLAEPSARAMGVGRDLFGCRKAGREVPVEIALNPVTTEKGTLVFAVLADITVRKHAEEVQRQTLQRIQSQFDAVGQVAGNEALLSGEVEQVAHDITELAAAVTGAERVNAWLFNEDESELHCLDLYEATPARHSTGMVLSEREFRNEFKALKTSRYVDANDPYTDPRTGGYVETYLKPLRITSMLDAVVHASGKNIGVLCIEHVDRPHQWQQDEITFACQLADKLGFTIINRQRHQAEDRARRLNRIYVVLSGINGAIVRIHERQALFEEACRIAVEHGEFRMAWIGILPEGKKVVVPQAWAGFEDGFLKHVLDSMQSEDPGKSSVSFQAMQQKKPVVINNIAEAADHIPWQQEALARGYHSVAAFPLIVQGESMGVFSFYAPDQDYFDEDEINLLTELASDVSFALQYIQKEEKANYLAYYDPLTDLSNRTMFCTRLGQYIYITKQSKAKFAVLVLDLQRFRNINDTFGRHVGDALIQQVAERLKSCVIDTRQIARTGADQFAMVFSEIENTNDVARILVGWIEPCFNKPFTVNGDDMQVSIKVGIALFPHDGTDADTLLNNAEVAVNKTKTTDDRYLFFTEEMTANLAERLGLESKLRRALEREEFVMYYQPKIDLHTDKIIGLEALIRWQSPHLGLVQPMEFIPVLEETGLIREVGSWCLQKVAADYLIWKRQALPAPRIAVNVSAVQLRQKDFVEHVQEAMRKGGAGFGLDLEITESLIMTNIDENIDKLKALKRMGVQIAIDDFGTGYSSLRYIRNLPLDAIKIDRSFIVNMTDSTEDMAIVSTIISLGHNLDLQVIAEGVDDIEQVRLLKLLKCDQMQGYLFSKPLPPDEIAVLLKRTRDS